MKSPSYKDAEKCIGIRKRSKKGEHVSREEHDFSTKMFKNYEDWFCKTEARVFNETVPYGSTARYKEDC